MAPKNKPFAWISASDPTRFRLAILLFAMFLAIVAGKLVEDSFVQRLQHDSASLFDDRLIPATTLFRLADAMHVKHRLVHRYLVEQPGTGIADINYERGKLDAKIATLLARFEKTYLVQEESRQFHQLVDEVSQYQKLETQVLGGNLPTPAVGAVALDDAFERVRVPLVELTELQERVGLELRDESVAHASSVSSWLYFQLGIAFILGLISSGLAMGLTRPQRRTAKVSDEGLH